MYNWSTRRRAVKRKRNEQKITSLKFDEKIYKSTDPSSVTDNQKKYKESNAMAYQNQITKYPVIKSNKKKNSQKEKRLTMCKGAKMEMTTLSSKTI